jgi:hypothetical protein
MAPASEGLATESFRPANRPDVAAATIPRAAAAIVDHPTDSPRNTRTPGAAGMVVQANGAACARTAIDRAATAIVDLPTLPCGAVGRVLLATIAVIQTAMPRPATNLHRAAPAIGSRCARSAVSTDIDGAAIAVLATFLIALAIEPMTATII